MELTQHARTRMSQRCGIGKKKLQNTEFKLALKKGYNISDLTGELKEYLTNKLSGQKTKCVKLYNDKIFLYNQRSKRLITVMNLPDEFTTTKDYLLHKNRLKDNKPVVKKYMKNKKSYIEGLNEINKESVNESTDIENIIKELKEISYMSEEEIEYFKDFSPILVNIKKRVKYLNNICVLLENSKDKVNNNEINLDEYKNKKFYKCRILDVIKFLQNECVK